MDRPTPVQQHQSDRPGPSSAPIPMEEGEIDSETDQDPSVLEVPAINWAQYVGVRSVQYVKMGHAPRIAAGEKKRLEPRASSTRNGEEFFYGLTAAYERDHE